MNKTNTLSQYIKVNRPYILRNVFIEFANNNKDINILIEEDKNHIREMVFKFGLECDINLNDTLRQLETYIKENILNYKEIKKVFKISFKDLVSPKTTFKAHLNEYLTQEYYINNILGAK